MRPAVRADQPAVPQSPARGHEHELEPEFGLPEALPADERILWQGQPQAALVARRIFHLPALALYFGVMLAWRVAVQVHDGAAWHEALRGTVALALLAAVALTIVATLARLTASTTAYTLTNKRVVMRIGIVLTVTYNLPLRQIDGANLLPLKAGSGEISLALRGDTRIAVLHLWPHARPWHYTRPQPMLRCLADAEAVAARLTQAWAEANATVARPAPAAEIDADRVRGARGETPQPVSA
jgi:hypothetical protein